MNTRQIGRIGEEMAVEYLRSIGYTVLTRNYRMPSAEADIIARDGNCLVAVEVKNHLNPNWEESDIARQVSPLKRAKIRRAVGAFLAERGGVMYDSLRLDVICIINGRISHYKGVI